MAYRHIVVATDGSASAETAEQVAATLAAALGAKLTIAHAYANPDRAGDAVERAEKIAEREGALHEVALSAEAPADAILMTASRTDTELIVIGSTGLSASEQLFGSVSRRVVTHAPSDVLLTLVMCVLGAEMAINHHTRTLPVLLIIAAVGVFGSISIARFVARKDNVDQ